MKNIKLILALFLVALVVSCEEEYKAPNEFSDVNWYNSMFRGESNAVGLEKYHSFSDLSRGALEHSWSIENVDGGFFLEGTITNQDTTYYQFVNKDAGKTTTDKTVHVLFTKPGEQMVRLYNTYSEYVEYQGNDTIGAVKKGDVWVIDTAFVVDVFDTIQPAFKVYSDMEETMLLAKHDANEPGHELSDSASWPVHEIEAGEAIRFVDLTVLGRPDDRSWIAQGGKPGNTPDSVAVINFYKLGNFRVALDSKRNGQNMPFGYRRQYVPLTIKVNKSSLPFTILGEGEEQFDETINLSFSGEIASFFNQEDNFNVHVTNPSGFDQRIDVQSARVHPDDGTIIQLTLAEAIYNTDNIIVSWAKGDTPGIQSLDERDLQDFSDVVVNSHIVNLLGDPGFEAGVGTWSVPDDSDGTSEYSMEDPNSGAYCYHLEVQDGQGNASAHSVATFALTKGVQYLYSYSHKTVRRDGGGGFEPRISYYKGADLTRINGFWTPYKAGQGWIHGPQYPWNNTKEFHVFTPDEDFDAAFIQLLLYQSADMYFDDFKLHVYEGRP